MFKSKDGLVRVDQVSNTSNVVFPPSAWSVVNLPTEKQDADTLFKNLFNTPTTRHACLVLVRHRRKDRVLATSNIASAQMAGWNYLDTVSIWYEKPSTCSNNGLLPLSEVGFLMYKGDTPDTKQTSWFSEDSNNASNCWNLATQKEEPTQVSYYQKFSWELNLLMLSLTTPMEYARFIYAAPLSDDDYKSLFLFCKRYSVGVQLYTKTTAEAESIIREYELTEVK